MSQYPPAFSFLMDNEDPRRQYRVVPDSGGYAISGINSKIWPKDYFEVSMAPQDQRPQIVYDFYQKNFWVPSQVGGLDFQEVANRVFDEGVNAGGETAIKLLQKSLIKLGAVTLKMDGILGADTRDCANSQDPDRLLAVFKNVRLTYYKRIVDNNAVDSKYLGEWEKRALA
jgi:lysozyme family protein